MSNRNHVGIVLDNDFLYTLNALKGVHNSSSSELIRMLLKKKQNCIIYPNMNHSSLNQKSVDQRQIMTLDQPQTILQKQLVDIIKEQQSDSEAAYWNGFELAELGIVYSGNNQWKLCYHWKTMLQLLIPQMTQEDGSPIPQDAVDSVLKDPIKQHDMLLEILEDIEQEDMPFLILHSYENLQH